MTSQLFKEKYPKDKFFAFLDKYCEEHPDFNDAMNGLYK